MRTFSFPVESGQALAFTRAIGENSITGALPLTFVMAADHFDPVFERRPQPGQPWLHTPIEALFHVEQTIEYYSPIKVGMQLTAIKREGRRWTKQGRKAGQLEFIETVTELRSPEDELLVRSSWVDVKTEHTHASVTQQQTTSSPTSVSGRGALDRASPPSRNRSRITRTQIVMYVGATGDFHPLHHDEVYAAEQGYPSTFAPGMLTMAINGSAVSNSVRQEKIRRFSGRFLSQVWPGDTLETELIHSGMDRNSLATITRNQSGVPVFRGEVICRA